MSWGNENCRNEHDHDPSTWSRRHDLVAIGFAAAACAVLLAVLQRPLDASLVEPLLLLGLPGVALTREPTEVPAALPKPARVCGRRWKPASPRGCCSVASCRRSSRSLRARTSPQAPGSRCFVRPAHAPRLWLRGGYLMEGVTHATPGWAIAYLSHPARLS